MPWRRMLREMPHRPPSIFEVLLTTRVILQRRMVQNYEALDIIFQAPPVWRYHLYCIVELCKSTKRIW